MSVVLSMNIIGVIFQFFIVVDVVAQLPLVQANFCNKFMSNKEAKNYSHTLGGEEEEGIVKDNYLNMQQSAVLKDTIIIMHLIALTEDSSTFIWKTRLKRYLSYVLSCSSDETMRDADAARTARQRFALLILKFIEKNGKNCLCYQV